MSTAHYIVGDTREVVAALPDGCVDLVLTSPPFLALRSYLPADHPDKGMVMGSEPTPAEFVQTLLDLSAEWRRILAPHGTLAVELGDTSAGSGGAGGDYGDEGLRAGQSKFDGSARAQRGRDSAAGTVNPKTRSTPAGWPDAKSLVLIPEAYRFGLAYGLNPHTSDASPAGRWLIRNVIRWVRPNPPVGALGDKFKRGTSDLVIACTSPQRWFDLDAVRTPANPANRRPSALTRKGIAGRTDQVCNPLGPDGQRIISNPAGAPPLDWQYEVEAVVATMLSEGAEPKDIARRVAGLGDPSDAWEISPGGYTGSHYAVFPEELCRRPIEAMCPRRVCRTCGEPSRRLTSTEETSRVGGNNTKGADDLSHRFADRTTTTTTTTGWSSCDCPGADGIRMDGFHTGSGWRPGIVLDPFGGSGTVGIVATGRGRDAILVDIDHRNLELARERVGMFLEETTATALADHLTPSLAALGVSP